jgi:hypothetical protein
MMGKVALAKACASFCERTVPNTCMPAAAKSSAIARPMPLEAPVTNTERVFAMRQSYSLRHVGS